MLNLTFKWFFPISIVYSLGRKNITSDDFKIIVSYYLTSLSCLIINIGIVFIFYKQRRLSAFAHVNASTLIQNIVITGMFITQGFYDKEQTQKYAYIISIGQFTFTIPLAYFLFEYAHLKEQASKVNCKTICLLILKSLINTLKTPMIIGTIVALIYNVIKTKYFPILANLPPFIENFFVKQQFIVSTFGIVSIGIFTMNQFPHYNPKIKLNQNKRTLIIRFIVLMIQRHLIFPIFQIIYLKVLGLSQEIIEINSSLASCNTALQAFALSDQYNFDQLVAGMMVLIGMPVIVLLTPILQIITQKIY